MRELIDGFVAAKAAEGLSPRTLSWYGQHLERFRVFVGDGEWGTAVAVRGFLSEVAGGRSGQGVGGKVSVATVRAYHRTLRVWFRWLVAEGVLERSPMERVRAPRADQTAPKTLSADDFFAILREARGSRRDYALVLFLADTGVREAEARGLRVGDVDLALRRATVTGKGRKSRPVFFTEETGEALGEWLAVRPGEGDLVFPGQRGEFQRGGIYQVLKRLAARAGVKGRFNPHAFRHFFASSYVANGGDLETLRRLLGHSDLETTRQYLHFEQSVLQARHDALSPVARLAPGEQLSLFDWLG